MVLFMQLLCNPMMRLDRIGDCERRVKIELIRFIIRYYNEAMKIILQ